MDPSDLLATLRPAFAEAYTMAINSDVNMRVLTDALESLRESTATASDPFALWNLYDTQLGRAGLGLLSEPVNALHARFQAAVIEHVIHDVAAAGSENSAECVKQWLLTAARCFGDGNWRCKLFTALTKARLPAVAAFEPAFRDHAVLEKIALCVDTGRWAEAYDWFLYLGRHSVLPEEWRARMLVIAAEIQLFHFRQPTRARTLLENAEKLAPRHHRVLVGLGEWYLERGRDADLKEAESYFRKIIVERPDLTDGYVNLGDMAERVNDLSAAESQYQQATLCAPGVADGYLRLGRLFGKPQWFEARAEKRAELLRRCMLLEPDEASLLVEEGDIYRGNRCWAEARNACERAQQLDRTRLNARTGFAYALLDEAVDTATISERAAECLAAMRAKGERAVADFPDAPDALWVMVNQADAAKDSDQVMHWCERIRGINCEWDSACSYREGLAHWRSQNFAQAEQCFRRVISLEPAHPTVAQDLNRLGDDAKDHRDVETAHRLYAEARRLLGNDWEYDYQNRLGNLEYEQGNYDTAVGYYRRAIAARAADPVLHSNLAGALVLLATPGSREATLIEAVAALRESIRLDPANADYPPRLRAALRNLDFVRRYGEQAFGMDHLGTPIRIDVNAALLATLLLPDSRQLSEETQNEIKALREMLQTETGVLVPPLLFGELTEDPAGGNYQISFFNEPPTTRTALVLDSVQRTRTAFLEAIYAELRTVLERFISHDLVAAMLAENNSPVCTNIREHPLQLTAFVQFLKARRRAGENIGDVAKLTEHFLAETKDVGAGNDTTPWDWETALPFTHLAICFGGGYSADERDAFAADLDRGRAALLEQFGTLVPKIEYRVDASLPPRGYHFETNEREIPAADGFDPDESWIPAVSDVPAQWNPRERTDCLGTAGLIVHATPGEVQQHLPGTAARSSLVFTSFEMGFALGRNMDLYIDEVQVEHRLGGIETAYPALVKSVRARFKRSELVWLLRLMLVMTGSLRNIVAVLEQLLTEPAATIDSILAQPYQAVVEQLRRDRLQRIGAQQPSPEPTLGQNTSRAAGTRSLASAI